MFIGAGYWSAPSDLNDFYAKVLAYYQQRGIPIPMQAHLSRSFLLEGEALYSRIPELQIGVSAGYQYSPAYSGYEDFAGTLRVDGSISSMVLSLVVHWKVLGFLWGQPLIFTLEPGLIRSSASINVQSDFHDWPQSNEESRWAASAWGIQIRGLLGTSVPIGPFVVGMHAGYQKSLVSASNGSADAPELMTGTDGAVSLDREGPLLLLEVGLTL